jgi:hypothetical protein
MLVGNFLVCWSLNKLLSFCPKRKFARQIGVRVHSKDGPRQLWNGLRKLFLESYFDMTFAVFLSLVAFREQLDLSVFFDSVVDISSSSLFIIYTILCLVFPLHGVYFILTNFKLLQTEKAREKNGVYYEDV